MSVDLDLDVLAPPMRTIRLDGIDYKLGGDIPARYVARLMRMSGALTMDSDDLESSADAMDEMTDLVAGLLHRYNPERDASEIADGLTLGAMTKIVGLAAGGSAGQDLDEVVVDTLTTGASAETTAEADGADPTEVQPGTTVAA